MAKSTTNNLVIFILPLILLICTVEGQWDYWGSGSSTECRTPDNLKGTCKPIRQCEPMLNILRQRQLTVDHRQFLKQARCQEDTDKLNPKICCPILTTTKDHLNFTRRTPNLGPSITNNPYLPKNCGREVSTRIIGGERTSLSEFPWMALLEYTKPEGMVTLCGGVLISKRYVLTAAHCLHAKHLTGSTRLKSVRLGEFDTSQKRDCLADRDNVVTCADDPLTVLVEEQIIHESYRADSNNQSHDIALIRLARDVPFTTYIKPICLPTSSNIQLRLVVAGWGKTEYSSESSAKLKLEISPADLATCSARYKILHRHVGSGQLCAGGERGKDSCHGDSGGPLMMMEKRPDLTMKWTTVGVVSFGPTPCGAPFWPGVYTKVADYVPWILSKLRP